jgi:hypothetical protein
MGKLLLLILLIVTLQTSAQTSPPALSQIDALFVVNADTVTVMYRLNFEGETTTGLEVPLTFPLSGEVLDVQLGDSRIFELLDKATIISPDYFPPKPCDLSPTVALGHGEGYTEYLRLPIEAVNYEVTKLEDDQRVNAILHLQTYTLQDRAAEYYGTVLHQSPLLQITYRPSDTASTLPLRIEFALLPESRKANLNVYVLAATPYTAKDRPLTTVDASQLRYAIHEVRSTLGNMTGGMYGTSLRDQYDTLVYGALFEAGEGAFLMQSANTTESARTALPTSDEFAMPRESLQNLLAEAAYLTRLDTRTSLNSVAELSFVPSPEIVPFTTDLNIAVDPVYYYGCTTETLYDPAFENSLPTNRVYVDALRTYVPLLDDWTLFDFEDYNAQFPEAPIYAAAPESLTPDQAFRHARGYANQITSPAMGLERFRVPYVEDERGIYGRFDISYDPLTRFNASFLPTVGANAIIWYWPHPETYPLDDWSSDVQAYAHGVKVRMVAPINNYAANAELYDNLLRYFWHYQYFTHANLRHTLFLGDLSGHIEVGYPEDWHTLSHVELGRLILPNGEVELISSPYVRIISPPKDDLQTILAEQFVLSEQALADVFTTPVSFENESRRGFVRLGADEYGKTFIIEFSAPITSYNANADLLQTMSQAMRSLRYEEDN